MFDESNPDLSSQLKQQAQYCKALEMKLDRVATTIDLALELIEGDLTFAARDCSYTAMGIKLLNMLSEHIENELDNHYLEQPVIH